MTDQPSRDGAREGPIGACVRDELTSYLETLDGHPCHGLHQMVIEAAEAPLFEIVMDHYNGNQTRAAEALGINRGTLRKKLRQYHLDR
ncbi:Fis family transcriptional regulator [Spiribacter sp. 2438]|uniref:helix-turn-helix domain-containing protein n=1 Tax=Spiribacter sp. 2438 TaxID=2666185 RepID=UPI0012AFC393|nr:helix-turn-helix domain-containing protein [Spiribacter sp. 2438]QGM22299.1 Fis family transcriptional regulator [Spiribacter sp. 2438]